MDPDAAHAYLVAHSNYDATGRIISPTTARIERLMELMGEPQRAAPAIHITGTNGKGSTARMIGSLFDASGRSTGVATSPHLERVNERIVWNEEPIVDDELARILTQIAGIEEFLAESPSYFEIMIAAAFTYFADVAVDVAVVEVGMGGTWDATNVVDGRVAVVTHGDPIRLIGTQVRVFLRAWPWEVGW
jgi:dihydrofolate synthase/folylpolyglutamate synthase